MLKPSNSLLVVKFNAAINCITTPDINMTKTIKPTQQWLFVSLMIENKTHNLLLRVLVQKIDIKSRHYQNIVIM